MGMSPKEFQRLTGKKAPRPKTKKKAPSEKSEPPINRDDCHYCDEPVSGAVVRELSLEGVYHAKCVVLEMEEQKEYERVKDLG